MKNLVFLIGLIFSFGTTLSAQESVNNFLPENNQIIWQKIFETEMDFNELALKIKESGILVKPEIEENKILGQTKPIDADYKGAGYGEMSTPIYVARSFFDGFAVIDFKDGKYRVTLKNIMLTQQYDDGLSKEGEKTTLEAYSLKRDRNEMKAAFTKSPGIILDYTFSKVFTFRSSEINDNW
jgi:hypothetical protein